MENKQAETSHHLLKAELFVSYALRAGVFLSATVILIGLIKFFLTGESGYPENTYPTRIPDIFIGALALKSFGIIMFGLLLLILTPVFRVGISILVFSLEKDWLYTGISAIVFLILCSSFFFGK